MHGVMAVLHEHAAPIAELHGNGDAPTGTQPVNVLAAFLSGQQRDIISAIVLSIKDYAFLEVDMDGVVPTAARIHQRPGFAGTEVGRSGDAAEICCERISLPVSSNTPFGPIAACSGDERGHGIVGVHGRIIVKHEIACLGYRD